MTQLMSVLAVCCAAMLALGGCATRPANPPGSVGVLLKAAGTPIDAFSYEAVELLRDTAARWQTLRTVRDSAAMAANKDPAVAAAVRAPDAEIFAIDVSFPALKDKAELD